MCRPSTDRPRRSTTATTARHSAQRGEFARAVGVSRGRRATRIRYLADAGGRIVALALTPGTIADITMALPLLEATRPTRRLISDKARDAGKLRTWLIEHETEPVIPGRATRDIVYPPNRKACRRRDTIERMFGRLKNWKRIATRYDPLAINHLAAVALIATVTRRLG